MKEKHVGATIIRWYKRWLSRLAVYGSSGPDKTILLLYNKDGKTGTSCHSHDLVFLLADRTYW